MHPSLRVCLLPLLSESQLDDARTAQRLWVAFLGLLRDPTRVARAIRDAMAAGRGSGEILQVAGRELGPELDGYVIRASPSEAAVFDDHRLIDIDDRGERLPDKELQVVLLDLSDPDAVDRFSDAFNRLDIDATATVISDAFRARQSGRDGFFHEVLHALHRERAGFGGLRAGWMGPDDDARLRRMSKRIRKRERGAEFRSRVPPDTQFVDVDRSTRSSEGYALMDRLFVRAMDVLRDEPDIGHRDFVGRFMRDAVLHLVPADRSRRAARMLSNMWHQHRSERLTTDAP